MAVEICGKCYDSNKNQAQSKNENVDNVPQDYKIDEIISYQTQLEA